MSEIIAMYSAPALQELENPRNVRLLYATAVIAFAYREDGEEDAETWYRVDCAHTYNPENGDDIDECPSVYHYWDGVNSTRNLSNALSIFNQMVTVIKTNEEYVLRRDFQTENYFNF